MWVKGLETILLNFEPWGHPLIIAIRVIPIYPHGAAEVSKYFLKYFVEEQSLARGTS